MAKLKWFPLMCISLLAQTGCSKSSDPAVKVIPPAPVKVVTPSATPVASVSKKGHRGALPDPTDDNIDWGSMDVPTEPAHAMPNSVVASANPPTNPPADSPPSQTPPENIVPPPAQQPVAAQGITPLPNVQAVPNVVSQGWLSKPADRAKAQGELMDIDAFRAIAQKWVVELKLNLNGQVTDENGHLRSWSGDEKKAFNADIASATREFIIQTIYDGLKRVQGVNPGLAAYLVHYARTAKLTFSGPVKTNDGDGQFKKHKHSFLNVIEWGGNEILLDRMAVYGLLEGSINQLGGQQRLLASPLPRFLKLALRGGVIRSENQAALDTVFGHESRLAQNTIFHDFMHRAGVDGEPNHTSLTCANENYLRDLVYACSAFAWPSVPVRGDAEDCTSHDPASPYFTLTMDACRGCAGGTIVKGKAVSSPETASSDAIASCNSVVETSESPDVYVQAYETLWPAR